MNEKNILPRKNLFYKCKKYKKKTEHIARGFRGHNYREECLICSEVNYHEFD